MADVAVLVVSGLPISERQANSQQGKGLSGDHDKRHTTEHPARHSTSEPEWLAKAQTRLDQLTKPRGSLGRLEELAAWDVAVREELLPTIKKKVVGNLRLATTAWWPKASAPILRR